MANTALSAAITRLCKSNPNAFILTFGYREEDFDLPDFTYRRGESSFVSPGGATVIVDDGTLLERGNVTACSPTAIWVASDFDLEPGQVELLRARARTNEWKG